MNGKLSNAKKTTLHLFQITILMIFLLSFALMLAINARPLYQLNVQFGSIRQDTHLASDIILKNYDSLMSYLNKPWVSTLTMPNFDSSYEGARHFEDVKHLFLLDYVVCLISGVTSLFFLRKLRLEKQRWRLIRPMQWAMLAPLVLAVGMVGDFNELFLKFHKILFTSDNWVFDPNLDPVINALPETFFMQSGILVVLLLEFFFFFFSRWGRKDL